MKENTLNDKRKTAIDAYVRGIVDVVQVDTNGKVRRKLSRVLHQCGYQARQADALRYLETELEHVGIYVDPPLLEARTTQFVAFHAEPVPPDSVHNLLLHSERELEQLLLDDFERIPAFADLTQPRRQVRLGRGTVDILCRDRTTRDYVVIELKVRQPGNGTIEQLIDYLREIENTKAKAANVGVRGIILSGRPDDRIMNTLSAISYRIDWLCYRVGIHVFPMPGGPKG